MEITVNRVGVCACVSGVCFLGKKKDPPPGCSHGQNHGGLQIFSIRPRYHLAYTAKSGLETCLEISHRSVRSDQGDFFSQDQYHLHEWCTYLMYNNLFASRPFV